MTGQFVPCPRCQKPVLVSSPDDRCGRCGARVSDGVLPLETVRRQAGIPQPLTLAERDPRWAAVRDGLRGYASISALVCVGYGVIIAGLVIFSSPQTVAHVVQWALSGANWLWAFIAFALPVAIYALAINGWAIASALKLSRAPVSQLTTFARVLLGLILWPWGTQMLFVGTTVSTTIFEVTTNPHLRLVLETLAFVWVAAFLFVLATYMVQLAAHLKVPRLNIVPGAILSAVPSAIAYVMQLINSFSLSMFSTKPSLFTPIHVAGFAVGIGGMMMMRTTLLELAARFHQPAATT